MDEIIDPKSTFLGAGLKLNELHTEVGSSEKLRLHADDRHTIAFSGANYANIDSNSRVLVHIEMPDARENIKTSSDVEAHPGIYYLIYNTKAIIYAHSCLVMLALMIDGDIPILDTIHQGYGYVRR